MRGGRVLLLVDPDAGADLSGQNPSNPMAAAMANHSSDLEPLLASWGVDDDPTKVIGDLGAGLEVRTNASGAPVRHIGILGLRHANMNPKDVVTASLESINMATVGYLTQRAGAKTTFEPLLMSSTSAEPLPAQRFKGLVDHRPCATGSSRPASATPLQARITGPVNSAYPNGPPPDQKPVPGPPNRAPDQIEHARQHRGDCRYRFLDGLPVGAATRIVGPADCATLCQQWRFDRQHPRQLERQQRLDQHPRTRELLATLRRIDALSGKPTSACAPRRWSCNRSCSRPKAN